MEKSEILNYVAIFLMFLPLILSFREIRVEFLEMTLTDTIINTLYAIIMGGLIAVLFPAKPSKSNVAGACFVIITVLLTITSFTVPQITITFSGWISGELNTKTLVAFTYHNFHYFLWLFILSLYLEHEIPAGGVVSE